MPAETMPIPSAQSNAAAKQPDPEIIHNPDARQSPFKTAFVKRLNAPVEASTDPEGEVKESDVKVADDAARAAAANVLEARKPKPAPAEGDGTPAALSVEGKADWEKLKGELKSARTERDSLKADLETKIKVAEQTAAARFKGEYEGKLSGLETLRKEHETLQAEFRRLAVEATPEWKDKFVAPLKSLADQAGKIVGADKAAEVAMLLELPNNEMKTNRLEELVAELRPFHQQEVASIAVRASEIISQRDAARQDHDKFASDHGARVQRQQQEQEAAIKATGERLFMDGLSWAKETLPVFKEIEGNADVIANVNQNIENVKKLLLGQNTPQETARAAFYAVYGQQAGPLLEAAAKEIEKMNTEIDKLRAAQPKGGQSSTATGAPEKPKGFLESIHQQMAG